VGNYSLFSIPAKRRISWIFVGREEEAKEKVEPEEDA